jgi:hypothetical protein
MPAMNQMLQVFRGTDSCFGVVLETLVLMLFDHLQDLANPATIHSILVPRFMFCWF